METSRAIEDLAEKLDSLNEALGHYYGSLKEIKKQIEEIKNETVKQKSIHSARTHR